MLTLTSIVATRLTRTYAGGSLAGMQSKPASFFGMTTSEFAAFAKKAGERAVADTLKDGVSVTGITNGKLVTVKPGDPEAAALIAKSRDGQPA